VEVCAWQRSLREESAVGAAGAALAAAESKTTLQHRVYPPMREIAPDAGKPLAEASRHIAVKDLPRILDVVYPGKCSRKQRTGDVDWGALAREDLQAWTAVDLPVWRPKPAEPCRASGCCAEISCQG